MAGDTPPRSRAQGADNRESVVGDVTSAHWHRQMCNTDDLGSVDELTAAVEKLRLLTEQGAVNFFSNFPRQ